jgi:outer membrane lipoprotein-sorting protein
MVFNSSLRNLILVCALLPLTGCLFRTHEVVKPASTIVPKQAPKEQLIETINNMASRVQSLRADVDIDTSVTRQKKGKANHYQITDYPEISGYVLVRKPDMLRMIGLAPVVRSTLFDMVSNGKTFALSIPPKNEFVIGSNTIGKPSSQSLENIRPQAVMDALLLKEVDLQNEKVVLKDSVETVKDPKTHKDVEQPDYELIVIRRTGEGDDWYLSRQIIFSREDLLPHRQLIYDLQGAVATDARYENFTNYEGTLFPAIVQIVRPIENYSLQLSITKLTLNQPLKDAQFTLNQPPGSKLINLDNKDGNTAEVNGAGQEAPKPMR